MVEVEIEPVAYAMMVEADWTWINEHGFAENPLWDRVEHARDLLRDNPRLGRVYQRSSDGRVIRRLLVEGGWHLYYWYNPLQSVVTILAVWYASRGSEPDL